MINRSPELMTSNNQSSLSGEIRASNHRLDDVKDRIIGGTQGSIVTPYQTQGSDDSFVLLCCNMSVGRKASRLARPRSAAAHQPTRWANVKHHVSV